MNKSTKIKLIFTDYSIDKADFRVTKMISEISEEEENKLIEEKMMKDFSKIHQEEMEEYLAMADTQREITKKRKALLKKLKEDFDQENKENYPEYYLWLILENWKLVWLFE